MHSITKSLTTEKPKVSVLLPNLNNVNFITERLNSIIYQTYSNWELLIVDGYSTDGSWRIIQDYAKKDVRFKITQKPRKGIYDAINQCFHMASGEYIYIATGDDTFMNDFLEEMVKSLDENLNCGIAHCNLILIDEFGNKINPNPWDKYFPSIYFGKMLQISHIRKAPHDGFLHLFLFTIYTSLTQLLIRREVFQKVGIFSINHGSIADYLWGMKASLVSNTVHVPKYLATWRRHKNQATNNSMFNEPKLYKSCIKIIKEVSDEGFLYFINKRDLKNFIYPYKFLELKMALSSTSSFMHKLRYIIISFIRSPALTIKIITDLKIKAISEVDHIDFARQAVFRYKLESNISII